MTNAKILVIEDDMGISHVMQAIFIINKIEAVFASTGKKGLALLQKDSFDLILCDIMLPDMLGYEILKQAKSDWQLHRIPFIFLTAFANPEDVRQGMNEGADDYITKPFSAQQLVATIQSRLSLKRQREQLDVQALNDRWFSMMNENFQHEFMTPLNGIMQASVLIQSGQVSPSAEELQQLAAAIESSGRRMMRNIRKLTLFSLVNSEQFLAPEAVQWQGLTELAQQCLTTVAKENSRHPELLQWPLPENRYFQTHPAYFSFILSELVDNALKHGTGEVPRMEYCLPQADIIQLKISNQTKYTASFSEDEIQPFKKFHPDNDLRGLGVGLFVAKKLAKALNWTLSIRGVDTMCIAILEGRLEQTPSVGTSETQNG